MSKINITYKNTNYFSKTVIDYLSQSENVKPFYNIYPTLENFKKQIEHRLSFKQSLKERPEISKSEILRFTQNDKSRRKVLVKTLNLQYKNLKTSSKTKANIQLLLKENTFTITTGHQLNLFTGPLYFLYKIISTINLTEELKIKYPDFNFVPIYWMATEDHDFNEIKYFNPNSYQDKKISWNKLVSGAVGRLNTSGLEAVFSSISDQFGESQNANYLKELFRKSYLEHNNLSDATRFLTNELFQKYGLVIIDADDKDLKSEFAPFVNDELLNQTSFKEVNKTIKQFRKNYKVQVNPREINLFYLKDNLRERIILENGRYKINNTKMEFSEDEILAELDKNPQRFSPNVIMRPLYQEVILPNLCYIGGGGELAYWFELKLYFEKVGVAFPMLLLRNSALVITEKQERKLQKLNVSKEELFLKQNDLINKKVKELSNLDLDFSKQKEFLQKQFSDLLVIAEKTDKSFVGAVKAQKTKQLKGLSILEKRLLKAEKRKLNDIVERIALLQDQLFPKQSLQERNTNFSELYLEYGEDLIPFLKENLKPLELEFSVLTL
jgi:bacillithiol biosynthesis cysteine-adding enzyme BshC